MHEGMKTTRAMMVTLFESLQLHMQGVFKTRVGDSRPDTRHFLSMKSLMHFVGQSCMGLDSCSSDTSAVVLIDYMLP